VSTRLPSPTDGVAASSDTSLSWQSRRELTGVAQGEGQRKTLDLIDRLKSASALRTSCASRLH